MMGNGTELHEGRWQAESCRALGASLGGLCLGWLADFVCFKCIKNICEVVGTDTGLQRTEE